MSSETSSTTLRCLNHFISPWATSPSIGLVLAHGGRFGRCAPGQRGRLLLLVAREEDPLDALLAGPLHHGAVLGQEDRDGFSGDRVVLLPHAGVAAEDHALVEIEVLGAPRGGRATVARHDPHVAGRDRPHDAVT